ncbi:hypothetical protein I7I51_04450 [Histoplasma capsulatum]|uniref:Uncharacterized protein n=1 Tax=Ajellomyces capsulatus TaxID=5037 RepID=A0A8A1MC26_AJECA|nr:hypothetical protein I7I51_04450 [Histoplasma capsulatum]
MFVSPPGPREISTWTNQPVQRRSEFKIPIIIIENKQSQRAALDVMRMWASADCRPQTVGQICSSCARLRNKGRVGGDGPRRRLVFKGPAPVVWFLDLLFGNLSAFPLAYPFLFVGLSGSWVSLRWKRKVE